MLCMVGLLAILFSWWSAIVLDHLFEPLALKPVVRARLKKLKHASLGLGIYSVITRENPFDVSIISSIFMWFVVVVIII